MAEDVAPPRYELKPELDGTWSIVDKTLVETGSDSRVVLGLTRSEGDHFIRVLNSAIRLVEKG